MLDFLWDLHQSSRINSAESRLNSAEQKLQEVRSVETHVAHLEIQVEKLILVNQALVELLIAKLGMSEAEIIDKVIEVDLRDGTQDGRMNGAPTKCTECGRPVNPNKKRCLYCGHQTPPSSILDRIQS